MAADNGDKCMDLRYDASVIIKKAIEAALPGPKVLRAMHVFRPGNGKLFCIAVGKAALDEANVKPVSIAG